MKAPTNKDSRFRRPNGRLTVFDNNSQAFQSVTTVTSSGEVAEDVDFVDEPCDIQSLASFLDLTTTPEPRPHVPLPASYHFPGKHNFNINFAQNKNDNNVVYSASRDKLYVAKDSPCVLSFEITSPVPENSTLRVMSVFTQPQHANSSVHRCMHHATVDFQNGVKACGHIIKCENTQTYYVKNKSSRRRSLIVPFYNPMYGTVYSTYVFKFTCLTSCPGGLNRRPIRVIFTLENDQKIIGRRSVEVKICSSPWRDCNNEDKQASRTESGNQRSAPAQQAKRKLDTAIYYVADVFQFIDKVIHSTNKEKENRDKGPFTIVVHDREEYEVLMQAKVMFEFVMYIRSLGVDMLNIMSGKSNAKKIKREGRR